MRHIAVQVKLRIDDHKYGADPEVVAIQAWEGKVEWSQDEDQHGNRILTYPLTVEKTKKYNFELA